MGQITERQYEALRLYAEMGSTKEVAAHLGVKEQTIKNLFTTAYRNLGVTPGGGAHIEAFRRLGWLRPS